MRAEGIGAARDLKLWPGGGREWDWTETNTHHVPGIQTADVQELLGCGAEVLVLSRGMQLVLKTHPETLACLDALEIPWHVLETCAAAELYNRLARRGEKVGGLFHSTC
jgi:hypothetical protein